MSVPLRQAHNMIIENKSRGAGVEGRGGKLCLTGKMNPAVAKELRAVIDRRYKRTPIDLNAKVPYGVHP